MLARHRERLMEMKEGRSVTEGTTSVPKRAMQDSVFRDLFQDPAYLLQLYQVLHPEDMDTKERDLSNVTISNVLMDQLYNDLAFVAKDRLLIMVEAQSTWSVNIVVRMFLYLAETWKECIVDSGNNPYGSAKLSLPKPEFYVIYTGARKDHPEWISLADEFLGGKHDNLELRAKVLYGSREGDILDQYFSFVRVYTEQLKEKGRTENAIRETIRICKDRNILKTYLESREKEVISIMRALFDEEYLTEAYGREREEKGREEGREEGREKTRQETAINMLKDNMPHAIVSKYTGLSLDKVNELAEQLSA